MSKELEALYRLATRNSGNHRSIEEVDKDFKIIEKALKDYEAIDNANPSEALECLEKLKGMEISSMPFSDEYGTQEVDLNDIRKVGSQLNTDFREYTTTIKQALLKAQANARSEEILQKHYEEGITLDSVRALKQERDNYKKILEVIKEKRIDIESFYASFIERDFNYDFYASFYGSYGRNKLTKEEFELLKEVLE